MQSKHQLVPAYKIVNFTNLSSIGRLGDLNIQYVSNWQPFAELAITRKTLLSLNSFIFIDEVKTEQAQTQTCDHTVCSLWTLNN